MRPESSKPRAAGQPSSAAPESIGRIVSAAELEAGEAWKSAESAPAARSPRFEELAQRADAQLTHLRERWAVVDFAVRVHDRDKEAAGTLLGSALALRLFLFFVPLVLFSVGAAGLVGPRAGVDSVGSDLGISGSVAEQIDSAFAQGGTTPWFAMGVGLFGIATTGRSLSRALVLSSALSWKLGGRHKLPVRAIGIVVGIVVGIALMATLMNRIREATGVAVSTASFIGAAGVYVVLWSVLYLALPRGTTDPGAALPGAAVVALVLAGLQAVSQLYLPNQIENASSLYGSIGVAIATLGWFFFIGRTMAFSFAFNAVVYEEIGSVSRFVFSVPGLRAIPARSPALARYFDLDIPPGRVRGDDEVHRPSAEV